MGPAFQALVVGKRDCPRLMVVIPKSFQESLGTQ